MGIPLSLLILGASLTGCATAIPLTYDEQCAARGMKLSGVTAGTSGGAMFFGGRIIPMAGASEQVSCVVPQSASDRCEINHLQAAEAPKLEWNERATGKRTLESLGYLLIIPGVVQSIIYSGQRSDAMSASRKIASDPADCGHSP